MKKYTKNIAYFAISPIFFAFLVLLILHPQHYEIPYFGTNLYNAISFFLGLISFSGAIIFLYIIKHKIRVWYLGIPLVIMIAVVTTSSFIYPALSSGLTEHGTTILLNSIIGQIATYLLAPFSALFFYSLKEIKKDITIMFLFAAIISILFSGLIIEIPTIDDLSPYLLYYWIIGMPIIGVLYLLSSFMLDTGGDTTHNSELIDKNNQNS